MTWGTTKKKRTKLAGKTTPSSTKDDAAPSESAAAPVHDEKTTTPHLTAAPAAQEDVPKAEIVKESGSSFIEVVDISNPLPPDTKKFETEVPPSKAAMTIKDPLPVSHPPPPPPTDLTTVYSTLRLNFTVDIHAATLCRIADDDEGEGGLEIAPNESCSKDAEPPASPLPPPPYTPPPPSSPEEAADIKLATDNSVVTHAEEEWHVKKGGTSGGEITAATVASRDETKTAEGSDKSHLLGLEAEKKDGGGDDDDVEDDSVVPVEEETEEKKPEKEEDVAPENNPPATKELSEIGEALVEKRRMLRHVEGVLQELAGELKEMDERLARSDETMNLRIRMWYLERVIARQRAGVKAMKRDIWGRKRRGAGGRGKGGKRKKGRGKTRKRKGGGRMAAKIVKGSEGGDGRSKNVKTKTIKKGGKGEEEIVRRQGRAKRGGWRSWKQLLLFCVLPLLFNCGMTRAGMVLTSGEGRCAVDGNCFSNYEEGSNYGSDEDCTFTADGIGGPLVFTHFDIYKYGSCDEGTYDDYLTIGGTKYCGSTAPTWLSVTAGEQIAWHSDTLGHTTTTGFRACVEFSCSSACGVGSGCEFAEGSSTTSCVSCPVSKYSDESSTASCVSCGSGEATTSTGSTSASDCFCPFDLVDGICPFSTGEVASGYASTSEGGTLELTAGTYTGQMGSYTDGGGLVIEKAISIGCTADNHGCILDGENDHRVVYVEAGIGIAVSLTGLKITKGSSGSSYGAGVLISSGSVTMTDCFISDNTSGTRFFGGGGGGVYVSSKAIANLVNCVLEGNSAGSGGGFGVYQGTATLYGCTFASNTASDSGSDIYAQGDGTVSVHGCAAGYYNGTQGISLSTSIGSTSGRIYGTPYSFSGCAECASGKTNQFGNATCFDCVAGRFAPSAGSSKCLECPAGYHQSFTGASSCDVCLAGTYSETLGSTTCDPCDEGKFLNKTGSLSRYDCLPCYESAVKSSFMSLIPAGSKKSCICREKEVFVGYAKEDDHGRIGECQLCEEISEEGTDCEEEGATLESLPLEEGFWRTTSTSTDIRACIVKEACVGGTEAGKYCAEGHEGPYCDVCEESYSKNSEGLCVSCEEMLSAGNITRVVVVLLLAFGLFAVFMKKFYEKYKRQFNALKATAKILFVSFQVIMVLPSIAPEIELPENFESVIAALNWLDLDFVKMISMGCLSSTFNFHRKLLVMTLLPIGICGFLLLMGVVWKRFKGVCFTLMLVVTYAVLPSVSTTIFEAFPCDETDVGRYMIADYSIDCDESAYSSFAIYSGIFIMLYPVGIPLFYTVLLWRRKALIMEDVKEREGSEELRGLEFLFENYKPEYWYFEVVLTVLRLLLTGILGLIEPGSSTQLSVGMLIAFTATLVMNTLHVYNSDSDNKLSVLSFIQIFLVMLAALVLKGEEMADGESFDKEYLGIVLIAVNVLVLVSAFVLAVMEFRRTGDGFAFHINAGEVWEIAKRGMHSHKEDGDDGPGESEVRRSSYFDVEKEVEGGEDGRGKRCLAVVRKVLTGVGKWCKGNEGEEEIVDVEVHDVVGDVEENVVLGKAKEAEAGGEKRVSEAGSEERTPD